MLMWIVNATSVLFSTHAKPFALQSGANTLGNALYCMRRIGVVHTAEVNHLFCLMVCFDVKHRQMFANTHIQYP